LRDFNRKMLILLIKESKKNPLKTLNFTKE
jgi:hypothetical protein